ncbi:hypothetical protein ABWJ92_38525 [Streptomyces sp. NPDC000609]|uniref:hypothetical protein n=1 Tax=Streptomyces sp. NPDC000609 TaxID=3160957 RepID=UPI00339554A3
MDRTVTPTGVITAARPSAGLIEDLEREDDRRGPEPEPESALRTIIISIRPDQPEHAHSRYATLYEGSRGGWIRAADALAPTGHLWQCPGCGAWSTRPLSPGETCGEC